MARPRLGDSDSRRLQMVITEDEVKAIDEWRFANRVRSRSEAIRLLVQAGLSEGVPTSSLEPVPVNRMATNG